MINVDEMKRIYVNCPVCHAKGSVLVPNYIFNSIYNGIASVQVAGGQICDHQMLLSVDRNFCVRGIDKIDFSVSMSPKKTESVELSFGDVISKLQTYATLGLLRSFIFNYKVKMIVYPTDSPTYCDVLNSYFNNLLPQKWHLSSLISQIPLRDLRALKYDTKECFVLNSRGIIMNQPWGKGQFFLEEYIIEIAAREAETIAQNIAIRETIKDLVELAGLVVDNLTGQKIVYEDDLKNFLDAQTKIKIKSKHLESICSLIERRFEKGSKLVKNIRSKSFDILAGAFLT